MDLFKAVSLRYDIPLSLQKMSHSYYNFLGWYCTWWSKVFHKCSIGDKSGEVLLLQNMFNPCRTSSNLDSCLKMGQMEARFDHDNTRHNNQVGLKNDFPLPTVTWKLTPPTHSCLNNDITTLQTKAGLIAKLTVFPISFVECSRWCTYWSQYICIKFERKK